jgi:hypothetical protein
MPASVRVRATPYVCACGESRMRLALQCEWPLSPHHDRQPITSVLSPVPARPQPLTWRTSPSRANLDHNDPPLPYGAAAIFRKPPDHHGAQPTVLLPTVDYYARLSSWSGTRRRVFSIFGQRLCPRRRPSPSAAPRARPQCIWNTRRSFSASSRHSAALAGD